MTRRPVVRPHGRSGVRRGLVIVIAMALLWPLSACTAPAPTPPPTAMSPSPSVSASPTATTPAPPALVPDGTAEENLPIFRQVVEGVWAGPAQVTGQAYVDALVAVGFDKSAMQLTPDTTSVGNPAESIEVSVRWRQKCLIGQVGPAIGTAVTIVAPALADGGCLLGSTRPIDW